MTIKKEVHKYENLKKRIKVKLTGTDGNIFALTGKVSKALKKLGKKVKQNLCKKK